MPELIPFSSRVARQIGQSFQVFNMKMKKIFWGFIKLLITYVGRFLFRVIGSRYWAWAWVLAAFPLFFMTGIQLIDAHFSPEFQAEPWWKMYGGWACVAWVFYYVWWNQIVYPARDLFKGVRYTHKDQLCYGLVLSVNKLSKLETKFLVREVDGSKPHWISRKDVDRFVTRKELKVASILEI